MAYLRLSNVFFFALGYLIGLASVVFKPSRTKTTTTLRDKGKTILFFNNFNSNLTKSLYKARTVQIEIPRLRQQSSNSDKTLRNNKVYTFLEYSIKIICKYEFLVSTCSHVDHVGFPVEELDYINTQKFPVFLFKGATPQCFGCFLAKTLQIRFPVAFTCV